MKNDVHANLCVAIGTSAIRLGHCVESMSEEFACPMESARWSFVRDFIDM